MSAQLLLLVVIATAFCVIAADHDDVDKRRFIRKSRDAQDLELDKRRFLRKSRGFDDEHYDAPIEKRRFLRKSRAVGLEDEASVEKRRFIRKSRDAMDESSENSVEKRRFIRKSRSLSSQDEHTRQSLINAQECLQSLTSNCTCERSAAPDQPLTCSCPGSLPTHCDLDRCCSLKQSPLTSRVLVACNC